jgi:beta-glucanase (GH16 family)
MLARLVILGMIACALASCFQAEGASGIDQPELIWSDEFSGDVLDRSKWTPELSCWGGGNNERQCYIDSPDTVRVEEGHLVLAALPQSHEAEAYPQDWPERGSKVLRDYVSGKVRTKGHAQWRYGRFEARIKLPKGQSLWPAFWMLPEENVYGEWPLSGEIDIMEAINLGAICKSCENGTENRSSAALHFGETWPENRFLAKKRPLSGAAIDDWHIYALDWREDRMEWSVDGEVFFTVESKDWFTPSVDKSENRSAPFDQPFYLMLNLAVGGNLPDNKNEKAFNPNSFPAEMRIDWVRVYK